MNSKNRRMKKSWTIRKPTQKKNKHNQNKLNLPHSHKPLKSKKHSQQQQQALKKKHNSNRKNKIYDQTTRTARMKIQMVPPTLNQNYHTSQTNTFTIRFSFLEHLATLSFGYFVLFFVIVAVLLLFSSGSWLLLLIIPLFQGYFGCYAVQLLEIKLMRRDSRLVLGHLQEIVGIKVYDRCQTLSSILHQILSKVINFQMKISYFLICVFLLFIITQTAKSKGGKFKRKKKNRGNKKAIKNDAEEDAKQIKGKKQQQDQARSSLEKDPAQIYKVITDFNTNSFNSTFYVKKYLIDNISGFNWMVNCGIAILACLLCFPCVKFLLLVCLIPYIFDYSPFLGMFALVLCCTGWKKKDDERENLMFNQIREERDNQNL